jgi:hypothetical protein
VSGLTKARLLATSSDFKPDAVNCVSHQARLTNKCQIFKLKLMPILGITAYHYRGRTVAPFMTTDTVCFHFILLALSGVN